MTITITHPQSRNLRARNALVAVIMAVVVTLATLVTVRVVTDGDASPSPARAAVADARSFTDAAGTTDVAEWAEARGLSGLSPASATRPAPSTLAEWAETEGVSGLSPASVAANS